MEVFQNDIRMHKNYTMTKSRQQVILGSVLDGCIKTILRILLKNQQLAFSNSKNVGINIAMYNN